MPALSWLLSPDFILQGNGKLLPMVKQEQENQREVSEMFSPTPRKADQTGRISLDPEIYCVSLSRQIPSVAHER